MRLLRPRSLFARLAWLLVAAVAVALAVSTWLMHRDRGEQYLRNRAEFNAHRLVELANWFDTLSPAERERLAPLVSLPGLGIRLARDDAPPERVGRRVKDVSSGAVTPSDQASGSPPTWAESSATGSPAALSAAASSAGSGLPWASRPCSA